jgi:catechol 2,3-dioxygenase-like lactoylglutathione lyase family enzyme
MEAPLARGLKGGVATIFVSDMDRAVKFYTESLGLKLEYRAGDHWASIDAGDGFKLGIHLEGKGPQAGIQGGIQIGFNVTSRLEDVIGALEANGVAFPDGIHDDDGAVRLAFFRDPDGNEHYLCEPKY